MKVNLDDTDFVRTGLSGAVLDLDVDDRITINGTAGVFVYDSVNQLVRGYTELLGNHAHEFTFNLSPSSPYDVGTIDGGTYRLSSGSSTLTNSITATGPAGFSVSTTNPDDLWTTDPANFPMDVMIGGERIRLSAIAGTSSPQTFTVAAGGRSINGVTKGHTFGTTVNPFDPWRLGL